MPLEIQDSDDDFAVTSPTHPDEEDESSPVKVVPEPVALKTNSTNEMSTDLLVREIWHAQQQLIRSSPARSTYTPPEPTSSPLRAIKRRKTANPLQVSTSEKQLGRRKSVKIYGSSIKRARGLLDSGSSLFDELKADEQRSASATITQREEAEPGNKFAEKTWDLPASLRQDFQEHEPVSMFPDPSSTVPDNTMTQQRLVEGAISNPMLPPPIQQVEEAATSTASSIPWSTYLESPEHKVQPPLKIIQISQMLIPDEPVLGVDPKLHIRDTSLYVNSSNTPPAKPVRRSRTPNSSSRKPSSGRLRRTKTMGARTTSSQSLGDLDDELAMNKPKFTARRPKSHRAETLSREITEDVPAAPKLVDRAPANSLSPKSKEGVHAAPKPVDRTLAEKIVAMLSQAPPNPSQTAMHAIVGLPAPIVQKMQKSKEKERVSDKEAATLSSEDLVLELPKEQYKPRSSRSRSTRNFEDTSIDYSKRPEKVVTLKWKRRKTTDEVSLGSHLAKVDAYKMAQIGSMGFSPRQTKAALMESSGNIERAIDNLIGQSSGGKEHSPSKPRKTRSNSTKEPAVSVGPSKFLGVEVIQMSGDKTFHSMVDDAKLSKRDVLELQDKGKDLEDEIGLDSVRLPAIKPSAQKRRRDKVVDSDEEDDFAAEPEPPKPVPKPASKRKVVDSDTKDNFVVEPELPKLVLKLAAKRTKSLPAKKTWTTDEKDDVNVTAFTQLAVKESKKGRGRPKKVIEAVVDAKPAEPPIAEAVEKVDKITRPKSPEPEKNIVKPGQSKEQMDTSSSTPDNGATPPSTPQQHSESSHKSAAVRVAVQHSPLNKSKVPLRVGLSRKKRIAPLLKIIKK